MSEIQELQPFMGRKSLSRHSRFGDLMSFLSLQLCRVVLIVKLCPAAFLV